MDLIALARWPTSAESLPAVASLISLALAKLPSESIATINLRSGLSALITLSKKADI